MQTEIALRAQGRKLVRAAAYGAALIGLTLTALGFAIAALYMALASAMGGAAAAAVTALALLAAAGVVELVRRAQRPVPTMSPSAAMSHDLATMVRDKPLQAVLLALTTGLTAGAAR
ncbi:MAG: hypothetical protein RIM84_00195 [Alphaproteobacteria bacterium]